MCDSFVFKSKVNTYVVGMIIVVILNEKNIIIVRICEYIHEIFSREECDTTIAYYIYTSI